MKALVLNAAGTNIIESELQFVGIVKDWKICSIYPKNNWDIVFEVRNKIIEQSAYYDTFFVAFGNQVGISFEECAFALDLLVEISKPVFLVQTTNTSHYSFTATFLKSIKILEHYFSLACTLGPLIIDTAIHTPRYLRQRTGTHCTSYPGPIGDFVRGNPFFYYTSLPPSPIKFLDLTRKQLKIEEHPMIVKDKFRDINPVFGHIAQYFETSMHPDPPKKKVEEKLLAEEVVQIFGLGYLPEEILLFVFSYLDIVSLAHVECVCKMWNRVANDQYLGVELDFSGTRPTIDKVNLYLNKSKNVKRIDMSGCQSLSDDVLWNWKTERLASLKLRGCRWLKNSSANAWLSSNFGNLQELDISWGLNIHDLGLAKLLGGSPLLKTLNISGCSRLTDKVLDLISVSCPLLTTLDCSLCPAMSELSLSYLSHSAIQDLKITISQKEDMNEIGYKPCHSVKSINFVASSLKLSFYKLVPHLFPNLHKFALNECRAVSEQKLNCVLNIKQVEEFSITRCKGINSLNFPNKKFINGILIIK